MNTKAKAVEAKELQLLYDLCNYSALLTKTSNKITASLKLIAKSPSVEEFGKQPGIDGGSVAIKRHWAEELPHKVTISKAPFIPLCTILTKNATNLVRCVFSSKLLEDIRGLAHEAFWHHLYSLNELPVFHFLFAPLFPFIQHRNVSENVEP